MLRFSENKLAIRGSLILFIAVLILCTISVTGVRGDDQGYTPQPPIINSTICTYNGSDILDYQLKLWIEQYIVPKGYHDMKFVFGECFGGGIIDEMLQFGSDAHPVVAMSASKYDECSYRIKYDYTYFLEAFKNALRANPDLTMKQAFDQAKANDPRAPGNPRHDALIDGKPAPGEHPQYASKGANADNLKLGNMSTAKSWKAILFVGKTDPVSWNDLDGIYQLLIEKFGFTDTDIEVCADGGNTLPSGGKIDWVGNASGMENAIKAVAGKMNNTEQLFFWVSDHGDSEDMIKKELQTGTYLIDYFFPVENWKALIMWETPFNRPFITMVPHNIITNDNKVFMNDVYLGNLSTVGGEQFFYFDDCVVPIYTDHDNNLTIIVNQKAPLGISDIYLSTGAIPQRSDEMQIPVGGAVTSVDKIGLFVPNIESALILIVALVASAVCIWYVTLKKAKR